LYVRFAAIWARTTPQNAYSSTRYASETNNAAIGAHGLAHHFLNEFLQDLDVHDSLGQRFLKPAIPAFSARRRLTSTASSPLMSLRRA
jgi:hypothetical protein